jgi:hypothetical protein
MSQQNEQPDAGTDTESDTVGISDDKLPEDLVGGEDNPLAEGLPDGERAGDLLEEGKQAEKTVYEPGEDNKVAERTTTGDDSDEDDDTSTEASTDSGSEETADSRD